MVSELTVIQNMPNDGLRGRRTIYTNAREITDENVVEIVGKAMSTHIQNWSEIQYLLDYFKGKQDIRNKTKVVRKEINNKVTVNRANEIVTFKSAYFLSEPIQYVSSGASDGISADVAKLNQFMASEDKESKDKSIVDWIHICGVGVRVCLAAEDGESPVNIYSADPRKAFCIYFSGLGHECLAGVLIQKDDDGQRLLCVYTKEKYYEIKAGKIKKTLQRTVPFVPIVEYLNNEARMGAFEAVISMLNAINNVASNRMDAIQDFVNAYDVFQNCEIDRDTYKDLTTGGKAICIKSQQGLESKVYRITSTLDQGNTQTVSDDMYEAVLTICGMPNRNGGSSTSDTGAATIMRDGWQAAESRAKDTEKMFNSSERKFLKIVLYICKETGVLDLKMSDIKIEHVRNNLSNMQSRMQILCEGLNNDKIHPKLPWKLAGIPNAEENYRISMEYYEDEQRKLEESLRESGQGGSDSTEPGDQKVSES